MAYGTYGLEIVIVQVLAFILKDDFEFMVVCKGKKEGTKARRKKGRGKEEGGKEEGGREVGGRKSTV